jgi:AhpC/TSA family
LPSVNRLYLELRDKGFELLLVSFREDAAMVAEVVKERGYAAPVLLDRSGEVTGKGYGVWGPPTAYFIDRQGRLAGRIVGSRDWSRSEARRLLLSLLEE